MLNSDKIVLSLSHIPTTFNVSQKAKKSLPVYVIVLILYRNEEIIPICNFLLLTETDKKGKVDMRSK